MTRPGHRRAMSVAEVHALARPPIRFEPLPDDGSLKIISPGLERLMREKRA